MKRHALWGTLVAAVALASPCASGFQQPGGAPPRSTITGRVLGEGGRAVAGADVRAWSQSGARQRVVATDDEGRFVIDDVAPGAYRVDADAPALVAELERADAPLVRPGEDLTIRLVRGAVITGKVTDTEGSPVIAIPVRAIRTRDGRGRALADREWVQTDVTDDRGVYRIFDLRPGTYLVTAGHSGSDMWGIASYHDGDAPTYYPSSGPATASPVTVAAGQELAGIDIAYKAEPGHTVAGRVAGGALRRGGYCRVLLLRPGTSESLLEWEGSVVSSPQEFAIPGVADGEYELKALWYTDDDGSFSVPKRVVVRGADLTGVTVDVVPFASVAGTVVVEKSPGEESCARKGQGIVAETAVAARLAASPPRVASVLFTAVNDAGAFKLKYLRPGTYFLSLRLPDRRWYVKAIGRGASRPAATAVDVARDGIGVAQGEAVRGVAVTVADGAASLTGRVVAAAEGASLPDSLRLYLVPAAKADAQDGTRYYLAAVGDDGAFALANIAPGRYLALVRREPVGEDGVEPNPAFWDAATCTALRRDAAEHGREVVLGRCQDAADLQVQWKPGPKEPAK